MFPDTDAQTSNNIDSNEDTHNRGRSRGDAGEGSGAGKQPPAVEGSGAGKQPPAVGTLQHAQLAALLSFKPSSRDVISGIAPHVLDDLNQRPPHRTRRRRGSSPDRRHGQRRTSSVPRRSPLRLSAVLVDDNGAIVQPESVVLNLYATHPLPSRAQTAPPATPTHVSAPIPASASMDTNIEHDKLSKRRSGSSSRIDRVLRSVTLVFRLK